MAAPEPYTHPEGVPNPLPNRGLAALPELVGNSHGPLLARTLFTALPVNCGLGLGSIHTPNSELCSCRSPRRQRPMQRGPNRSYSPNPSGDSECDGVSNADTDTDRC